MHLKIKSKKTLKWKLSIFFISILFLYVLHPFSGYGQALSDLDSVFEGLVGKFSNAEQVAGMDPSISQKPALKGEWLNTLCLQQKEVFSDEVTGRLLFLEWREGDCQGKLSRQRIWAFREDPEKGLVMNFYGFKKEGERLISEIGPEEVIQTEELISYPSTCLVTWEKNEGVWRGFLNPENCLIVAQQSGRELTLMAEIVLNQDGFRYKEKGSLKDGRPVFIVPGLDQYHFKSQKP